MPENPFFLPPQSIVSFSGGRTSGYMLHRILEAHGGKLPDDRRVVFCNTGKERPETLDFVQRCSLEWDVPIAWLEYRWEPGRHYFVEVNYATASRNGEPFRQVIQARGFLPNPVMRFCTVDMKLRTTNRYVRQSLGWSEYMNAIGIRADEPSRRNDVCKPPKHTVYVETLFGVEESEEGKDPLPGESPCCPLFDAGVTHDDVLAFWANNSFDLALEVGEGNCDLCFMKGAGTLLKLMEKRPQDAEWWAERERERELSEKSQVMRKRRFALFNAKRPPYAELLAIAIGKEDGPGWLWSDKNNGSCGEISECRCTD